MMRPSVKTHSLSRAIIRALGKDSFFADGYVRALGKDSFFTHGYVRVLGKETEI